MQIGWTLAALAVIALALAQLHADTEGLVVRDRHAGPVPLTVRAREGAPPAPAVVLAHGFAGSRQLMQPFALTLARQGLVAVSFDFPGHGRNHQPLPGGIDDFEPMTRALTAALDEAVRAARSLPESDGRVALLGHSMATDVIVRYAIAHDDIAAVVAVSLFSPAVTAEAPRNLLVVDGALEPAMLLDEARRVVALRAPGEPAEGVTYGSFADGSARRLVLADGVEHVGVLYSEEAIGEAAAWIAAAFGREPGDALTPRGPWIALLFLGVVLLARPLARLLPRVREPAGPAEALPWRRLLPAAAAPAVLTPLLAWPLPGDFLPLLLADYLLLHFALYGLLTAAAARLAAGAGSRTRASSPPADRPALVIAAVGATVFAVAAIALPMDAFFTAYLPTGPRAPLLPLLLAGTLAWFLADEWLTRELAPRRGAWPLTKACFLLSIGIAIALDPERLFFLAILMPVMVAFFTVHGLFSRWCLRATGHFAVGGIACAVAFAWAMAATFPLVAR